MSGTAPVVPATIDIEDLYCQANGDPARLAWHRDGPNLAIVAWLNVEASAVIRPGATAAVVGCGLGDDVAELCCRGYDVTGFDVSHSAVEWARRRHVREADMIVEADLLDLPSRMRRRFDLVIEAYTLEWIDPSMRRQAAQAIASLARPHGTVVMISHGRDEDQDIDAPPYLLSAPELTMLMSAADMHAARPVDDFYDDAGERQIRGVFHH